MKREAVKNKSVTEFEANLIAFTNVLSSKINDVSRESRLLMASIKSREEERNKILDEVSGIQQPKKKTKKPKSTDGS
eukprot:1414597-Pyramimonas_sp.AAC.1